MCDVKEMSLVYSKLLALNKELLVEPSEDLIILRVIGVFLHIFSTQTPQKNSVTQDGTRLQNPCASVCTILVSNLKAKQRQFPAHFQVLVNKNVVKNIMKY